MEKTQNKSEKFLRILSILLGIIVCNNVIYAFKAGRTYINISYVFAILIFIILLLYKKNYINNAIKSTNKYVKIFTLVVMGSILPAAVVFSKDISQLSGYFNGIIAFILYAILYIDIMALKEHKNKIIKGLAIGFVFNILLSLVQYITYESGNYFSLYYLFPQPAFQINSYYGLNNFLQQAEGTFNIYAYRAQGFFLETSYYMAFIAGTAIILFVTTKKSIFKILSIISMIFIIAMTSSGNMIIVLATFVIYYIAKKIKHVNVKQHTKKIKMRDFTYITIVVIVLLSLAMLNYNSISKLITENNIYEKIVRNINTANIANEDNEPRLRSMMLSLKLIPEYPLGVGYNLSSALLSEIYDEGTLEANTAFNMLIKNQLELGILGTIVYLAFIYQISVKLILKSKNAYTLALGIGALAIFVCQVGNGISFYPFIIMVFALANIEYNELKKEAENGTGITK